MKRSWWAVLTVVVAVSVVLLTQPWRLLSPAGEGAATPASQQSEAPPAPDLPASDAWAALPDGDGDVVDAEEASGEADVRVEVDTTATQQTWRGAGATLDDASVAQLRDADAATLQRFAPVSWLRLPLSSTGTSSDVWTWEWRDGEAVPPAQATAAMEVAARLAEDRPDLRVVATPWTAPASMKDGDALRPGAQQEYADLLVAQVAALQEAGVPVGAVTLGNAPASGEDDGPTMTMTADQQAALGELVRPELDPDVDLWAVDDGWSQRQVYDLVLTGAPFASFDGAAFHCDDGEPRAMAPLPVAPVITSCGEAAGSWGSTDAWSLQRPLVASVGAGSTGLLLGDLAPGLLDQDGAVQPGLTLLTALDHAAPVGSKVVTSGVEGDGVAQVAFVDPDGGVGVLAQNTSDAAVSVAVSVDGEDAAAYVVEPGALLSVRP